MNKGFYRKTILDNGIRIISEQMPHLRSISIGVWIIVGSRDETIKNNGISHVIEHMLFKGTEIRDAKQIAQSLESVGGHLDAFTAKEVTCYSAHILDEDLPLAVDILSDILQHSVIDENELTKEKEIILREINHTKDTPDELIFEYFYKNLFPDHPLGFQISGTSENVLNFSRDDLINFMHQNYTPDRMIIAAAGNINHDQLVKLVQKKFDYSKDFGQQLRRPFAWKQHQEHIYENNCTQTHICLGTRGYAYADKKKYAFLIVHTLLGGGMSSRLFQTVREINGLAYAIYTFPDFYFDTGVFGVYLATMNEQAGRAVELVKKELIRLSQENIDSEELDRIKFQLKRNLMLGLENANSRMGRLANIEIYLHDYFTLDEALNEIESVTRDQVDEVAEELFANEHFFLTILKPKNSIDGSKNNPNFGIS